MIVLEETSDNYEGPDIRPPQWADPAEEDWSYRVEDDDKKGEDEIITAINIVTSPWDDEKELVVIGFKSGIVDSYIIDSDEDGEFDKERAIQDRRCF